MLVTTFCSEDTKSVLEEKLFFQKKVFSFSQLVLVSFRADILKPSYDHLMIILSLGAPYHKSGPNLSSYFYVDNTPFHEMIVR
jgi:hypothetical protein